MYRRVRRFFCALFAFLVLWPLAAGAQTGATSSQNSDDLTPDKTFLAGVTARDDAQAILGELKRITSYHDKLKSGLGLLFASLPTPTSYREARLRAIDDELQRLQKFEDDINGSNDEEARIDFAKKFDGDYPLDLSDIKVSRSRFAPRNANGDPLGFARRERANANEFFQNVSLENRQSP